MTLTPRELDVMVALAVTGGSYAEAGHVLGIKVQTVKNHALAARTKLKARSNTAAYTKLGWLTVPYDPPWFEYRSTY